MRSLGFRESDGPNTQESRKNHNLTLVRGLEHFGVDPRALADLCKKSLGANTTIGEWVTKSGEKDQLGRLTLVHFCVAASSLLCSGTFGDACRGTEDRSRNLGSVGQIGGAVARRRMQRAEGIYRGVCEEISG
jgi:hypothetical protein